MRYFLSLVLGLVGGFVGAYLFEQYGGDSELLTILSTPEQDALNLPFAEGVQLGDVIYLSGQLGVKPGSLEVIPGGITAQTRQTLENIKNSLERYGSGMDQVLKCTVFMADMADWPAMNEVYKEMFAGHRPARSALGAGGLALGAELEIECIARVNR